MNKSTPATRLTRLLAEGARILAIQGNDGGIDITHDIQGLLAELEKPSGAPLRAAPAVAAGPEAMPTTALR